MKRISSCLILVGALTACGGGGSSSPVAVPPPTTTLAPVPTPDPALASCNPLPPKDKMIGFFIKVQPGLGGDRRKVINASPLIQDADYCHRAGVPTTGNNGDVCTTREEGDPQREACDLYVTGTAKDTGRRGPTWYWNGELCVGNGQIDGCGNHPDNQFLAFAFGTNGRFEACGGIGSNGTCGVCLINSDTGKCVRD